MEHEPGVLGWKPTEDRICKGGGSGGGGDNEPLEVEVNDSYRIACGDGSWFKRVFFVFLFEFRVSMLGICLLRIVH